MINNIILVGNLTKNAEIKEIKPGLTMGIVSIAVDHTTKTSKEVLYIDVKCWNAQAKELEGRQKGEQVSVIGRLKTESWTDKESGKTVYKQVVMANSIEFDEADKLIEPQPEEMEGF